jgi:hypothetical protein
MTDAQGYAGAWRDRQWRRAGILGWLIVLFPYIWLLTWAGRNIYYLSWWLVIAAFLGWRLVMFRCPRCGKLFAFSSDIRAYGMKNRPSCIHCGLVVGTLPPAS